jgi:hypothetical protein
MYIIYLGIFIVCIVLALCHFVINLIGRRKVKEETRDYNAKRESFALAYNLDPSTEQLHENPIYQTQQDDITISTDGSNELRIEMPEDVSGQPMSPPPAYSGVTTSSDSHQRPLQKIPEEHEENNMNNLNGSGAIRSARQVVSVEVHREKESARSHNRSKFNLSKGNRNNCVTPTDTLGSTNIKGMISGPVTVAVATVSALVAQATHQFDVNGLSSNEGMYGLGNLSRPSSASSCFDISDIVESPEMSRKKMIKSKTC